MCRVAQQSLGLCPSPTSPGIPPKLSNWLGPPRVCSPGVLGKEKTCGHNLLDWSFQPILVCLPLCFLLLTGRWRREVDGYQIVSGGASTEEACFQVGGAVNNDQGQSLCLPPKFCWNWKRRPPAWLPGISEIASLSTSHSRPAGLRALPVPWLPDPQPTIYSLVWALGP